MSQPILVLDTNALVGWWNHWYPPSHFGFWDALEAWAEVNPVRVHDEVYRELGRQDDDLMAWMNERRELFYEPPSDEVDSLVGRISSTYLRRLKIGAYSDNADPYVIACAKACGGTVICDERTARERLDSNDRTAKYKMPNICDAEEVRWERAYMVPRIAGMSLGLKP